MAIAIRVETAVRLKALFTRAVFNSLVVGCVRVSCTHVQFRRAVPLARRVAPGPAWRRLPPASPAAAAISPASARARVVQAAGAAQPTQSNEVTGSVRRRPRRPTRSRAQALAAPPSRPDLWRRRRHRHAISRRPARPNIPARSRRRRRAQPQPPRRTGAGTAAPPSWWRRARRSTRSRAAMACRPPRSAGEQHDRMRRSCSRASAW